jgi:hypothetical protein
MASSPIASAVIGRDSLRLKNSSMTIIPMPAQDQAAD